MLAGLTFGDRSALEQEHLAEARENKERARRKKKKHNKQEKSKTTKHEAAKLKHKKAKDRSSTGPDPSDSGSDGEGLEQQQQAINPGASPAAAGAGSDAGELQREDWMTTPMPRSQIFSQEQEQQEQEKPAEPEEPLVVGGIRYRSQEQAAAANERAAAREAAAAAAGGGSFSAAGLTWRLKAVQRAQQLAKEQGRYVNEVLSERWGSAADIAKGLIDGASAAAASGNGGSTRPPSGSQRPVRDRHDAAAAPHYLAGVRSAQLAMKRPTGLSSGNKLSWRRPGPAERTSYRDRDGHRHLDGPRDRDSSRNRDRPRDRDSSREGCSGGNGDRRDWHSRGRPERVRRDRSPAGDGQHQHAVGGEAQGSRAAQDPQEGEKSRERNRGGDRHVGQQQNERQQQQQQQQGAKPSWREQQQQRQQSEVVEALKAVAGHINTYSRDGSFMEQCSRQQQQAQNLENDRQGHQAAGSTQEHHMQETEQGQPEHQDGLEPTAAGTNRGTTQLLRAKLAARPAAAGGLAAAAGGAAAGNKSVAEALRARLSGKAIAAGDAASAATAAGYSREEVVHLPLIDASGRAMPGAFGRESAAGIRRQQELAAGRRVNKRVQRYGADGQRERYFADDDHVDLQTLVKRAKHGDDAVDFDRTMASNIAARSRFKETDMHADAEYDHDAGLELSESRLKCGDVQQQRQRERQRQVAQFNRAQRLEDRCTYCFSSALRPKELAIAVGQATYLSLVQRGRLVEGHCCIVPAEHVPSTRQVDDNTWTEIRNFQKCLIRMFMEAGKEVLFLETATGLGTHRSHAVMECIPVDQEVFAKAPMYFKKALQEAESEWSQHASKAVIDTKAKGLRGSIPPNFPYIYIQFGYANGFVHVIDNESRFDKDLGRQVVVGLLKLPAEVMHSKQRAEAPQVQGKRAAAFRQQFGPFDWTKALE